MHTFPRPPGSTPAAITARDLPRGGHLPGEACTRFQLRLRDNIKQRVMALAIQERRTQNQMIEMLLTEAIDHRSGTPCPEEGSPV